MAATDWTAYDVCPRCGAAAGVSCGSLAWYRYDPNNTRPHRGRRKVRRSAATPGQ